MQRVSPGLLAAVAAGHTVLAPNTELAAALFDAVERSHRDAGRQVWRTPRVLDFSSWLRDQYAQSQLSNADTPRCLTEVEERELWRAVIDSDSRDFLDPAAAARAASRARRTMREYGIPAARLSGDSSEETRAFLDWNQSFEERCKSLGCISADSLLAGIQVSQSPITWIESPIWRPVVRRWLTERAPPLMPEVSASQQLSLLQAASPPEELASIAEWAKASLQSDARFRAWVCIPHLLRRRAEIIDAFDAALAPQRFTLHDDSKAPAYAVAGGTPLSDYAPVQAALRMLGASVGLVSFAQFSRLLRAPDLQASDSEAGAAARLDVALRSRAPSDADLDAWLQIADRVAQIEAHGAAPAVQRLRAARLAQSQLKGNQLFSKWVAAWLAAIEAGPWALRARWSSVEFQAAERFRELLGALATAEAVFGSLSQALALQVLRRSTQDTAFQPQTGVPAIWVSGQATDPWLNYAGLWVSGLSDGQWPPPVDPVALLPIRLQREYGIISASAQSQMSLALDLQERWQMRAAHCQFSWADEGDGRLKTPSAILPKSAQLTSMPAPARPHWLSLQQAAPVLQRFDDEWAPPFSSMERTRGTSTLKHQSRCAFRGFAHTRLITDALEQPVPGFNDRERGNLVHHALEHVWTVLKDSKSLHLLSAQSQQHLLEEAAQSAVTTVCRQRNPGARWQARERLRLLNLLDKWLDVERLRAPFAIEVLEQKSQVAHFAGLDFRVRIDRIDSLADGARVLIDYKSGSVHADWRGQRPDNPQLPMYAQLEPQGVVAVAYGRVNARDPGFVLESERANIFKAKARATALEDMQDFAGLVELWRTRLEQLAAAFAAGSAEVAPTLKACASCHLQGFCRVAAPLEEEPT
jgi:ATP-dependent helicase/nuclease subunit B